MAQARRACRALHALTDRGPGKPANDVLHSPGNPHHALRRARWAPFRAPAQAVVQLHGCQTPEPATVILTMLAALGEKERGPPNRAHV